MRPMELTLDGPRPMTLGSGRLAAFLAGSAALGSLIIALLVIVADLDDEFDDRASFEEDPEE
jgi:hypothetical protein